MASLVVDTSVMIDYLRGVPAAISLIGSRLVEGTVLHASEISRAEVLAGLREGEARAGERFFKLFEWLPVDEDTARRAGEYARSYRDKHPRISLADFLMAASADGVDAELITLNVRDFPMFPALTRPY